MTAMAKARRPIAADDVGRIFDDKKIAELAAIAKLPATADRQGFAEGIREAARIYARAAREPTDNDLHREIEKLHRAADRQQHDQLAALIDDLSSKARNLLNTRGARLGIMFPSSKTLRGALAGKACAAIVKLTQFGGEYRQGRKRPGGKRSSDTWRPYLYAPSRQRNFPKREAERNFTMWLAAAYRDATGRLPARTADNRAPGPFARMVRQCLGLVGADANAVELINELHRPPAAKQHHRQVKARRAAKARKRRLSPNKP